MRSTLLVCFCLIASGVLLQPFFRGSYGDFFGYLTNSILYFAHLPFITVVLLSAPNQIPRSVIRHFPIMSALSFGVWVGVQCIFLLQTNNGTYNLLTMKEAVPLGIGVIYNEVVHTLPVGAYIHIYISDCSQIHKTVETKWQWEDLLTPIIIGAVFMTLNADIDEFYQLSQQNVWIAGGTSLAATLFSAVIIRRALNKKVNI